MKTKEKIKACIALGIVVIVTITGFVLSYMDRPHDIYPEDDTRIMLYGETHGQQLYNEIEFDLWKGYYDEGCRSLFVELPYYTAEYLNIWMKEDSDEIIDQIFEDIKGTACSTESDYEFYQKIKQQCPETVFYGTDVGHQYDVTGARYLEYLESIGQKGSKNYRLAEECIEQGRRYREEGSNNGISEFRESSMTDNFVAAYARCGSDRIMGIYGSYHTDLTNKDLMAGRIKERLKDKMSSVDITSIAYGVNKPYRLGVSYVGIIFLLMLFIPNIYWGAKAKPKDYDKFEKNENKILLAFERAGEVLVTCSLVIFPAINPYIRILPTGVYFDFTLLLSVTALILMIFYECYWIRYFKSEKTMKDQYRSFLGFPVAGASLPVISVLLLGLYSRNLIIIASSVILGIGHIGIHYMHKKEAEA